MKRRVVAMLLVAVMMASGCASGTAGEQTSGSDAVQTQSSDAGDVNAGNAGDGAGEGVADGTSGNSADGTGVADSSDGNSVGGTGASATDNAPRITTGGSPWIDSNLKENITDNMEVSLKDNFHLAVNYDWLKKTELDGSIRFNTFDEANGRIFDNVKALLHDEGVQGHDAELVRDLANAMMDWDARNAAGIAPMTDTIEAIRGVKNLDELSDLICDPERNYQVPKFVNISNQINPRDTQKYIVSIDAESFLFDSITEYTSRSEAGKRKYEALKALVSKMLSRAGYSEAEAIKMLDTALEVESELADGLTLSGGSIPGPQSLGDLGRPIRSFPIERYIKEMGYGDSKKYQEMSFQYLSNVDALYKEDKLSDLKDYMIVKFVVNVSNQLDREACDAYSECYNNIYGTEGDYYGEASTVIKVQSMLSEPLTKMYLEKYDETELKERIKKLIKDVTDEYRKMLQEEEWLSDEMKEKAIEKLDNMVVNAIYPDEWKDYSSLDLSGLSYWDCLKAIKAFERQENLACTNGEVDRTEWLTNTFEANGFYYHQYNSINILLGIMGDPLYYDGISDEELYAGVGTVIGHEISHAFDINGASFDQDGKMANWWTRKDQEMFYERSFRLSNYLKTITVWEGANVNDTNVGAEAMADITGMEVILRLAEQKKDFDYDKFFRSYAGLWREVSTYEYEYSNYAWDSHLLNFLRTNVTLQQFDKFYETYDIQEGDGMYLAPENRILIW